MARVLRSVIPADDTWHEVHAPGVALFVATRGQTYAEVWTLEDEQPARTWEYRIFGTGQSGAEGEYCGTAITPGGKLVWHVFCREVRR